MGFCEGHRGLWSPWTANLFIYFSRPRTLSFYSFVSLPASPSLNHGLYHRFISFKASFTQVRSTFTRHWLYSFCWCLDTKSDSGSLSPSTDIFTTNLQDVTILSWKAAAISNITCSAYMLLCDLMPHRTDSECTMAAEDKLIIYHHYAKDCYRGVTMQTPTCTEVSHAFNT